jgi:hypothetical protein
LVVAACDQNTGRGFAASKENGWHGRDFLWKKLEVPPTRRWRKAQRRVGETHKTTQNDAKVASLGGFSERDESGDQEPGLERRPRGREPLDGPELTALTHHPALFAPHFTAAFGVFAAVARAVHVVTPWKQKGEIPVLSVKAA